MPYTTIDALAEDFATFRTFVADAIRTRDTEKIRNESGYMRKVLEARCVSSPDRTAATRCVGLAVELFAKGIVDGESGAESPLYIGAGYVELAKAEAQARWCANPDWSAAFIKPERFA